MENQSLDNIFGLSLDEESQIFLKSIVRWAKIISVCAFVGYGVAILAAILGRNRFTMQTNQDDIASSFSRGSAIAGAVFTAIIGTAINYFLYRFAVDAQKGLSDMNQGKLNEGLLNLKTYFKILGIILLVVLILVGLVLLLLIVSLAFRK